MKKWVTPAVRHGLTLIELVVVMAILGVLAAMLLPRFEGMTNAANEAAAASSSVDAAKLIGQYKAIKTVYPDRWDSLTDGTNLWTAGSVPLQTRGLHSELTGTGNSDAKLVTATLTTTQVTALNKAGLVNLLNVNAAAATTILPGNQFTTEVPLAAGGTVAIVNSATTQGKAIIDHIYRQNLLTTGISGTINNTDATTVLMVFGLGPQNALIPNSMMEAPTYGNAEAAYIYNRLLAVFEVSSTKATFKAMLGADGDTLDTMSTRLQSSSTSL